MAWWQAHDPATGDGETLDLADSGPANAVVLAGVVRPGPLSTWVLTGPRRLYRYRRDLTDVLRYLTRLRPESEVRATLADLGAPSDFVTRLVSDGRMVRVRTSDEGHSIHVSSSARLVVTSKVSPRHSAPDAIYVTPDVAPGQRIHSPGDLLLDALWRRPDRTLGVLAALRYAAESLGVDEAQAARELACELPRLIDGGYARFEVGSGSHRG